VFAEIYADSLCVFWEKQSAGYLLNRAPTKALNNMIPYEAWHGKNPKVSHLRTFGCMAHVKVTALNLKKLSDRSRKMVFIGYESGTKEYRLFDLSTNRLVVRRDVIFEENVPWECSNKGGSADQQLTDSFIVEYEVTGQNPTIAQEVEVAGSPSTNQGGCFLCRFREWCWKSRSTSLSTHSSFSACTRNQYCNTT
jgi:hypothetical protein